MPLSLLDAQKPALLVLTETPLFGWFDMPTPRGSEGNDCGPPNARGQRPSASSASARSAALRSSAVFCTHVGWTSCQLKTSLLLDHTSRPQQDGRGNRDAERLCRPRIEDQIDFRRLFNGEVPGPGPLQDPVDVDGAPPP